MNPNELNELFERLGDRLNRLGTTATRNQIMAVNSVISDWQDWYWGNLDQWNQREMPRWETQYAQVSSLLDRLEAAHGSEDEPVTTPPIRPEAPPIVLPTERITAPRPWWYYGLWGLGALLAVKVLGKAVD